MPERRPRLSLAAGVTVVVIVVAALPVPLVAGLGLLSQSQDDRMRRSVEAAAEEAAVALRDGRGARAIEVAAERARLRIRTLDEHGVAQHDVDRDERGATTLGLPSVSTAATPALVELDARLGPLGGRPEVLEAAEHGSSRGCTTYFGGRLLVCEAVSRVQTPRGTVLVHAQKSAVRGVQRLLDVERPLATLVGFVLVSGLLLAAWLVRRVVRPLERLRVEVRARIAEPERTARPLGVSAPPEIAEVVGAFDALLAARAAQRRREERSLADLAHELKSPLTTLRAATELLASGPDPASERLAAAAAEAVRRIDLTVAQLLELARAEAGLPSEPRERLDLRALVAGVLSTFDDTRAPGVRVDLEDAGEPALVDAAAGALAGALRNLIENAASFARARVVVRVRAGAAAHLIEVRDDGPGVPPEDLPRVFDRFFTRRAGRGGTGLGLALARAVVEAHGGRAEVASEVGAGACFRLIVPAA
jgi:signal transduction histidine kinase